MVGEQRRVLPRLRQVLARPGGIVGGIGALIALDGMQQTFGKHSVDGHSVGVGRRRLVERSGIVGLHVRHGAEHRWLPEIGIWWISGETRVHQRDVFGKIQRSLFHIDETKRSAQLFHQIVLQRIGGLRDCAAHDAAGQALEQLVCLQHSGIQPVTLQEDAGADRADRRVALNRCDRGVDRRQDTGWEDHGDGVDE